MKLRDVGEFGLIDRVARRVARTRAGGARPVLGIGDDAALLRARADEDVAVSTDACVEGVHFRWDAAAPATIGRRAAAAALSDLAAMGARPLGMTIALAAPPAADLARIEALLGGVITQAARAETPVVGGNVTRSRQVSLTLTAIGAVVRGRALRRDAARVGDRILVTGQLGAAAFDRVRAQREKVRGKYVPEPRLAVGRRLARLRGVGACIDVSDGLVADLHHLLRASGVGAAFDEARVPQPRGFPAKCRRLGVDPRKLALHGGEDYELLFTLRPGAPQVAQLGRRWGIALAEIGRVTPPNPRTPGKPSGWRHF